MDKFIKEDIGYMIGIIGAMEEEVAALKDDMEVQETIEQASIDRKSVV